ncbi:phytase [Hyphomonas sp. WL0036]|uniref:phytase n=1 Tax=Hyphomonas sediminis TaxID=2866160 RepID=UPI001C7FEA2D|nr:phytase [Hyphomonas sediminis]MBY9066212.1 phytase [Hyphomonas sediminis]
MTRLRLLSAILVTAFAAACASAPAPVIEGQKFVPASIETAPAGARGDAADDPAVWRHPESAGKSLILGTNKREGLVVFSLDGAEVQRLPIGLINNVDIRQSSDRPFDIAVASNDQVNAISIFLIDRKTGEVSHRGDIPTLTEEPYGVCQAREDGQDYAGVTYKDGLLQVWAIDVSDDGLSGEMVDSWKFDTQLEGCVFDEANGTLFVGEEDHGLWAVDYKSTNSAPLLIDAVGGTTGLVADVEGVSIWRGKNGDGWVIASAQAENRYVVYDRKAPYTHRGSFSIQENESLGIDKVTHTDGLDIFSGALPGFPRGILVVQDDGNPRSGQNQNFKIVDWLDIQAALSLEPIEAE